MICYEKVLLTSHLDVNVPYFNEKNVMTETTLDARLQWIADQVRPQVFFVDVGSDHARLPIYLVRQQKIASAIATDIASGAVAQGQAHVTEHGLEAQIAVRLGDGLQDMTLPEEADITICGMGADSICAIIAAQPALHQRHTRWLLQAMTDTPLLREFLAHNGFAIETEACVFADGRYYQCMVAVYTGIEDRLSLAEREFGRLNLAQRQPVFLDWVAFRQRRLQKWLPSKQKAGENTAWDEAVLQICTEVLSAQTLDGSGL